MIRCTCLSLFIFLISTCAVRGQENKRKIYYKRLFQFSLAPGVGSNGLNPGSYINYISLNLSSGYSAANELIEIGVLSNLQTDYARGLQIAGLINITGGNAFAAMSEKEKQSKVKAGFEANLYGAQFSGVANIVVTNGFGIQCSGGINLVKNALFGMQIAGISNTVMNYSFGVQIAGLYNSSARAMDGVQIGSLFNFTNG